MVLIFISFFITFFHEILFLGKSFFVGDGIFIYAPHKIFIWESLKKGILPLWNPNLWGGFPEIGDMVLGVFDPFNIFYFLFPGTNSVTLIVLVSYFLALSGTYLFLKRQNLGKLSSFAGAMIFTFSGSMINISPDPIRLETICFLPWIIMAIKNRRGLATMALLCLSYLVGQAQYFYMSICFIVGFLLFNSTKKRVLWFLLLVACAFGLTAFTTLPQLELLPFSSRANTQMNYNTIWSLHPASLMRFFLADFWGKQTTGFSWGPNVTYSFGYIGFIPLILILLNLRHINRRNCFFAVAAATSLLISLGKYNPFYGVFLLIPGFAFFRNPSSWLTIYSFSAACLTADLLEKIKFEGNDRLKKIFYLITVILLLIGIPLLLINYYSPAFPHQFLVVIASAVKRNLSQFHTVYADQKIFYFIARNCLILGVLLGIFCFSKFKKAVFVLVVFFDLLFFSKGDFFVSTWANNIFSQTASLKHVKFLQKNLNSFRFVSTANFSPYREISTTNYYQEKPQQAAHEYQTLVSLMPPNIFTAYNIPSINGYSTFTLKKFRNYFQKPSSNLHPLIQIIADNQKTGEKVDDPTKIKFDLIKLTDPRLASLSVKYILSSEKLSLLENQPDYRKFVFDSGFIIYENLRVMPRAQIFDKNNHLQFLPHLQDLNPNEVKVSFENYASKPGDYLLLRDTYYPGWQAIDQNNKNLDIAADGPFRKTLLNQSIKQVHFKFEPKSFYLGLKISLGTLLLLLGYQLTKIIFKKK